LPTTPAANDAATSVAAFGGAFLVTGTAQQADPSCAACIGTSHVADSASMCAVPGDGGTDAGDASVVDGGAGGASGGDASTPDGSVGDASVEAGGGSEDAAPPLDAQNLFTLLADGSGACSDFVGFGVDAAGTEQIGFDIAGASSFCGHYVTGLAGTRAFRMGEGLSTTLFSDDDELADGFITRFDGGDTFMCEAGDPNFSLSLAAQTPVSGVKIAANRCDEGATAAAFAFESSSTMSVHRCRSTSGCSSTATTIPLGDAMHQLVLLGIDGGGGIGWHGSVGPVRVAPKDYVSLLPGRPQVDLVLDSSDEAYVFVTATDTMTLGNFDVTACPDLDVAEPLAGTWLLRLSRGGAAERAACTWARRVR
jgi:hypothetical protein